MTGPARRHRELAAGCWGTLSLAAPLANVGAGVGRLRRWRGRGERLAAAR